MSIFTGREGMIDSQSSLQTFQDLNRTIYCIVNDRNYSNADLVSYVLRHITRISKGVRKGNYDSMDLWFCMASGWLFAVANRFHISLEDEMWKRFPRKCPYCAFMPCACKKRAPSRSVFNDEPTTSRPASMQDWQKMFFAIYPDNSAEGSAWHLFEEIGELSERVRNFSAKHDAESFEKIKEEAVDVLANLFAVASCLKIDLAEVSARYFANGCPECEECPCQCSYVTDDDHLLSH